MIRLFLRACAGLTLLLVLGLAGFAPTSAKSKTTNNDNKADDSATATAADTKADETTAPDTSAGAALPAQTKSANQDFEAAPRFTPMLATTGTIGLFTVETADTLPKGGFAFSVYGNKFGRMPGSVTIFQLGIDASYGLTDRLNVYADFDAYQHAHVGCGPQLSLAPPNNGGAQYPGTIYHTLVANTFCNSVTPTTPFSPTPGYVIDFPFVGHNGGGVGEVTLGLKYAILSERKGNPFSLSVRNDIAFSTRNNLTYLLNNGTQGSPLTDLLSLALSKQWSNVVTTTFNFGYEFVRDPRINGQRLFQLPDQYRAGAGFLLFPESRFQPMMEYSAIVYSKNPAGFTPDTSFGAKDPIDGVWGLRMYPWKSIAIDAGYRYMLNLKDLNDRNGFVVKVGVAHWPENAPPPPANRSPSASCSADKSMVYVGSGDVVAVTATASDPDSDPLTYTWTASGGRVDGNGPQVRWLSTGTAAGSYTVTLHVDDGRGGSATCNSDIRVEVKPNRPPTIACTANPNSVFAGERSQITCNASDPDGDPLTYTWRANAGRITGNGPAGDYDTTGLSPGTYTITTRVEDGRGGAADASTTVNVKPVPVPPQASKINECLFGPPLGVRIDNVCKRILDDVALRLQSEPRASAVIIGYSDPKERRGDTVAGNRGTNAVKYLGEKGIDASRITTRTGSGQAGADARNRRIDVIFVPEGATY